VAIPAEDRGSNNILPTPIPPVPPPEGDPATLHAYARRYLQLAWWTKTLRDDLITTGRWILHGLSLDGDEYIERKLLGLVSEAGLHQRGYTLAAHACEQYAKRLEALKTGNAALNRQAGAFNQRLTVLVSKCAKGIPAELAAEVAALHRQRRKITDAIDAGRRLEQHAADSAADDFLAAKILNSRDMQLLRQAADPNLSPDQRKNLLAQAFGFTVVPGTRTLPGLTQAQAEAQFAKIVVEFEASQAAARGGGKAIGEFGARLALRGASRVAVAPLGIVMTVALDLALFPDKLADGDIDDTITYNRPYGDAVQRIKLYDADGNEIRLPDPDAGPKPEPAAGGAGDPPYNCDDPADGDKWGGPGYWRDVNRGDYDALWKRYQEQITGVARDHEYHHKGVDFDGYQNENGQHTFIEAKSRFYSGALKQATIDTDGTVDLPEGSMAEKTMERLYNQLTRQLDALRGTPNARLRYIMAEGDALEKVKAYAKQHLDPADFNKIDWEHIDNDFDFDGC
jgi:Restriction endonuclease fold toxin 5